PASWPRPTPASTSSRPRPGATLLRSCAPGPCPSTTSTLLASTRASSAMLATAISSVVGRARARSRSRRSSTTCYPSSPTADRRSVRAAVSTSEHPWLAVEQVPDPVPEPGDLILRVDACGICGSDLHMAETFRDHPGTIYGHEFCGTVVALGNEA